MLMQLSELSFRLAVPIPERELSVDIDIGQVQLMEIFSYILHPRDETRRAAELSLAWGQIAKNAYSEYELQLPLTGSTAVDRAVRMAIRGIAVDKFAAGYIFSKVELKKAIETAGIAAEILATIRGISQTGEKGSLNKAVFVLDKVGIVGRTAAFNAWRSHKSIAHLRLATGVVAQMDILNTRDKVDAIIGVAGEVQAFAIIGRHIPQSEIWEVPRAGREYEMDHFRLNDDVLAALKEYRAPT